MQGCRWHSKLSRSRHGLHPKNGIVNRKPPRPDRSRTPIIGKPYRVYLTPQPAPSSHLESNSHCAKAGALGCHRCLLLFDAASCPAHRPILFALTTLVVDSSGYLLEDAPRNVPWNACKCYGSFGMHMLQVTPRSKARRISRLEARMIRKIVPPTMLHYVLDAGMCAARAVTILSTLRFARGRVMGNVACTGDAWHEAC